MDGGNNGKPYLLMDDLGENPLFSETPIYYISKKSTNEIMGKSLLTLLTLVDLDHPPPPPSRISHSLQYGGDMKTKDFIGSIYALLFRNCKFLSAKINLLYGKILFCSEMIHCSENCLINKSSPSCWSCQNDPSPNCPEKTDQKQLHGKDWVQVEPQQLDTSKWFNWETFGILSLKLT